MNFDDYAEHIYQKHRLCIAVAVLKSKPANLNSTQYIEHLQSKLADIMDDDETVCSEDFVVDDADDSDFDDGIIGDGDEVLNDGRQASNVGQQSTGHLHENISQTTFYNSCKSQIEPNMDDDVTYFESDPNIGSHPYIKDTSQNNVQNVDKTKIVNDIEFNKKLESNLASTDTDKTIIYTVHGFTQNYTHYSPSQNEVLVPNKYLYASNNDNKEIIAVNDNNTNVENNIVTDRHLNNTNINSQSEEFVIETNFTNNINKDRNILYVVTEDNTSENSKNVENYKNKNVGSQYPDVFTQNLNNFNDSESILNTQHAKIINNNHSDIIPEHSQNVLGYFNEIHHFNDNNHFTDQNNENRVVLQNHNFKETFELTQSSTNFSQINNNIGNSDSQITNIDSNHSLNTENHIKSIPKINNKYSTQDFGPNSHSSQHKNFEITQFEIVEEESDTIEVIPYKVLEEFNKIKTFLNRRDRRLSCDGYSTDSGYRSDSLRSSNRSALQSSFVSINQSAYCLLNHIMQCPLVSATRDITSEIAETLGQLIDRLHEEETYPPFLEELLDTIDILLRQVYKGQGCEDNEFLKKDEFIQRILLLTKSIHIQKHAIEKITNFLIKFHERITDKNITYELTNIDEVENASYIFHILEILLKKYIKNKNTHSQSSQLSQDEEKILKKSSITDIWRKKWNSNFKENSEGSCINRCVLKECSDILNKIIVECVNSYSLVAFSALKCFNSMQTS